MLEDRDEGLVPGLSEAGDAVAVVGCGLLFAVAALLQDPSDPMQLGRAETLTWMVLALAAYAAWRVIETGVSTTNEPRRDPDDETALPSRRQRVDF